MADVEERVEILETKVEKIEGLLDASLLAQQESLFLKKMKNGLSENEKEQYEKLDQHLHQEEEKEK